MDIIMHSKKEEVGINALNGTCTGRDVHTQQLSIGDATFVSIL
jgi:hypothetical protein